MPGRFSFFFACLSARFSFSDFPGFLLLDFFGDLSATGTPHSLAITGPHHARCQTRQASSCLAVGQCTLVAQPARSKTRMTTAEGSI